MRVTGLSLLALVLVGALIAFWPQPEPTYHPDPPQTIFNRAKGAVDSRAGCLPGYLPFKRIWTTNVAILCYPGARCDYCEVPSAQELKDLPKDWYLHHVPASYGENVRPAHVRYFPHRS